MNHRASFFVGLALLGGCHLVGGADDLDFDVEPSVGGAGAAPATTVTTTQMGGMGGAGGAGGMGGATGGGGSLPGRCGDGIAVEGELCLGEPQETLVGEIGLAMAVVDCDMDGDLDIVVAGRAGDSTSNARVRALRNMGNASFAFVDTLIGAPNPIEGNPLAVITGDFKTSSGERDLALVLADGNVPRLYRFGYANGCAYGNQDSGIVLPNDPAVLAAGRIDGDAFDDVVVTFGAAPELWIFHSADSTQQTITGDAAAPAGIVAGDFDGDELLDVAYTDAVDNEVIVRFGDNFSFPIHLAVATNPIAIAMGDLDGDGVTDLVTANGLANSLTTIFGDGLGAFQVETNISAGGKRPQHVALGDVDGDGDLDIVASNGDAPSFSDVSLSLFLNDGVGNFAMAPGFPFPVAAQPVAAAIVDLNGDDVNDLVYLTQTVSLPRENRVFVRLANP